MTADPVLDAFGVAPDALLGEGIESRVFALDSRRVLRLPRADKPDELSQRAELYASLSPFALPFALPTVLDHGAVDGHPFVIEARLPGRSLMAALADPGFTARDAALDALIAVPDALATVDLSDRPFGEMLGDAPIRTAHWGEFLRQRTAREIDAAGETLRRDVPDLDATLAHFHTRLDALPDPPRRLVHGDLYPGNVMVGESGAIMALIDFSILTLVGDPDLDRTGALAFLTPSMSPPVTNAERMAAARSIAARLGAAWPEMQRIYRLYYALRFAACASFDPNTYRWLVNLLNGYNGRYGLA